MKFKEVNLIIEGVSKAQKEAGQRAMATQAYQLKNQLVSWFNNRWSAKNAHKAGLTLDKKKTEKERLDRILKKIEWHQKRIENSDDYTSERTKGLTGAPIQWETNQILSNTFAGGVSYPNVAKMNDYEKLAFKKGNPEDFIEVLLDVLYSPEDNIPSEMVKGKLNVLHEYKHLLDMFKQIIVSGKCKGVDTHGEIRKGHIKKIQKFEGKTNAHALDNTYRKDRLLYLANTPEGKKILNTKVEKAPKKVTNIFNDIYAQGTARYSKTLDAAKKNINPATIGLFHRMISSYFKTADGKQFLKKYNCNIKDFYNIEIIIEPKKDLKDLFEFSNGKFYLGKDFFELFSFSQNKFIEITKDEHFLRYAQKKLKEAAKYIKESRSEQ